MDYEPGTGSRQLFPKMHLETCGGLLSGVKAMVDLQTNHIGKGCDRETYSEKSLQKLCGESCERCRGSGRMDGNALWGKKCCAILRAEACVAAKGGSINETRKNLIQRRNYNLTSDPLEHINISVPFQILLAI